MGLLGSASPLKENSGIRAEFVDHLPARAAWRAGDSVVVGNGNGANLNLRAELSDCGKNCGPFGAVSHAVRCVLDIAAGKDLAVAEQNGGTDMKIRIRCVRILHRFTGGSLQFLPQRRG